MTKARREIEILLRRGDRWRGTLYLSADVPRRRGPHSPRLCLAMCRR
jgi:hypothetical protein